MYTKYTATKHNETLSAAPTVMLPSLAEVVSTPSGVHRYETSLSLCCGPHDCAGLMCAFLLLADEGNRLQWAWMLP